jgi:hypothetical protein
MGVYTTEFHDPPDFPLGFLAKRLIILHPVGTDGIHQIYKTLDIKHFYPDTIIVCFWCIVSALAPFFLTQ